MTRLNKLSIIMTITIMGALINLNESEAFTLFGKTVHVKLINRLSHDKKLLVHCKSKDNDLGEHWLNPGQEYAFNFGEKILWTTLFFCGFTFDGQKHWSRVYDAEHMDCREHCWWEIRDSETCLYKDGSYTECHSWQISADKFT